MYTNTVVYIIQSKITKYNKKKMIFIFADCDRPLIYALVTFNDS